MRPRQEYKKTTNSSVFRKLHKYILEKDGDIRCSRCSYHRGENDYRKWYGKITSETVVNCPKKWGKIRRPNWKLVSKNSKQWMKKPIKIINKKNRHFNTVEIKW